MIVVADESLTDLVPERLRATCIRTAAEPLPASFDTLQAGSLGLVLEPIAKRHERSDLPGGAARKITAAITHLLDQPPEEIATLVDKADDARIPARRTARRRLTEPASG